jgi:hypothetical protein
LSNSHLEGANSAMTPATTGSRRHERRVGSAMFGIGLLVGEGDWAQKGLNYLAKGANGLHTLGGQQAEPKPTTLRNDIRDVIDVAPREVLASRAVPLLSRDERLEVFRALDVRFSVKRAMSRVAAALGVSRAPAYVSLQTVRADPARAKPAKLGVNRAASVAS